MTKLRDDGKSAHSLDMNAERARAQREQLEKYLAWKDEEGGMELPVQLPTLAQPEQIDRVRWLVSWTAGMRDVLEVGCSWGYILGHVPADEGGKRTGVDINPRLVELARLLNRGAAFEAGDVRRLPFTDRSYDVVLLAEVLEHLPWGEVRSALIEACRVARQRVLITVPVHAEESANVKHQWRADTAQADFVHLVREEAGIAGFQVRRREKEFSESPGFLCLRLERTP